MLQKTRIITPEVVRDFIEKHRTKRGILEKTIARLDPEIYQYILDTTVDIKLPFKYRMYACVAGLSKIHKCANELCDKEKGYRKESLILGESPFNLCCSNECVGKMPGHGSAGGKAAAKKFKEPGALKARLEKAKKTSLERYGTENVMQSKEGKERLRQSNLENYGVEWSMQRPEVLEKANSTNEKRHGATRSPCLNKNTSRGEDELVTYIKELGIEDVVQSYNFLKGKTTVEIDVFVPSLNIGFEYNGLIFHSELMANPNRVRQMHYWKTKTCETVGIHLIHLWEDDWKFNKEKVRKFIKNVLGLNDERYNARSCKLCLDLDNQEYNNFLDAHHLLGSNMSASIRLGLKNSAGELVAIMGFKKSPKNVKKYGSGG